MDMSEFASVTVIEALRKALELKDLNLVVSSAVKLAYSVFSTVSDRITLDSKTILRNYFIFVRDISSLVRDIAVLVGLSESEADVLMKISRGEFVVSTDCIPVRLARALELDGVLYERGSMICLPVMESLNLIATGLVSPLTSGVCYGDYEG